MLSPHRRSEIIDALRRGTVPRTGLDAFAVGLERFAPSLDESLDGVARGRGAFKAVRGEYGCGKTFFARWLPDRARSRASPPPRSRSRRRRRRCTGWRPSTAG